MEIWVEFESGKWRVSPDPAEVTRGTSVLWRFRADKVLARQVRWSVYFDHDFPLALRIVPADIAGPQFVFGIATTRQEDGQHTGTSPVAIANEPGDYKYGVRAEDVDSGETLGDEDPRLIVR